jgi:lipoprotein-anchoring transpeptidase ErfK/SrfK
MRSRRHHRPGPGISWLGVLLGLGFLGWIFWRSVQVPTSPQQSPPSPPIPAIRQTQAVEQIPSVPRTNLSHAIPTSAPPSKVWLTNAIVAEGTFPRAAQTIFEGQVALARHGISPGSLDGVSGSQTRAALRLFQRDQHLPITGALDAPTQAKLILGEPPLTNYVIQAEDLARLRPVPRTWLGKSQARRLDYETILELVAEKGHAHPDLIRRLNPAIDWSRVVAGQSVVIPAADYPLPTGRAAFLRIHLAGKTLEAFDSNTNLLAHFPCSIARLAEKRPIGELHVILVVHNPNYVFNPDVFPESEEGRQLGRRLVLPAGPNNPVGTVWMGLNKPGYGIHGTPHPEDVGRTESHGCFRLANWNAEYLAQLIGVGTPVRIEP